MKIAFLCIYSHPSICGVWSRVYSLAEMLVKKGHDVHVFSTNIVKGTDKTSSLLQNYKGIVIHRFKPKIQFGENTKFWNFSSELKKFNPDIIISEVYRHPHTTLALKIAKKLKKPCFLVTHAPFVEPKLRTPLENFIADFYDKFYGRKVLNQFDKVITITRWEVPYLLKLGCKKEKIVYVPNAIPDKFFKFKNKKGQGLLFLGRISPVKNLETLIFAMELLVKKHQDIILKIVGPYEAPYKKKLVSIIKKLGLEKRIKFYPAIYNIKKKIEIIDSSEIFVLPSKREAMPQSLVEAMARRKIVIASQNKGSEEIIKNNENGFLFSISNKKELAKIIEFCLDKKNRAEINKIRENAFIKAKRFCGNKVFRDFYRLIKNHIK